MGLSVDITKKLKNFSLSVNFTTSDTTLGILGASGCGKSLTLKSIAGIITPDSGQIVLNGKVLFDSEKKINLPPQKRKVGYLFQNYALFPNMTVEQNIGSGIVGTKVRKAEKIKEMMETFCLKDLEGQYPVRLSGGQQQRVALARIMASDVDLLLLDEPFSALDYFLKEQLEEQLLELIKEFNKDVILVTHDRDEAFKFCEKLAIMDKGHVICKGELKDIFRNPEFQIAAKLTGCKNFSRAKKISDKEIYANDWNLTLQVEQNIPDDLSHVGIRAHDLTSVFTETDCLPNIMKAELVEILENTFEMNIILRNKNQETNENKIWWKISKKQWFEELHSQVPEFISFPSKYLLLLKSGK